MVIAISVREIVSFALSSGSIDTRYVSHSRAMQGTVIHKKIQEENLKLIKGYSKEEVVALYEGKGYADLKKDVADAIVDELSPIQEKVNSLLKDKKALEEIYKLGAEKANYAAIKTLRKMQKKIGLIPR